MYNHLIKLFIQTSDYEEVINVQEECYTCELSRVLYSTHQILELVNHYIAMSSLQGGERESDDTFGLMGSKLLKGGWQRTNRKGLGE
jgi:hypothetical protein